MAIDKVVSDLSDVAKSIPDGAIIACGGFGACGTPVTLIEAVVRAAPHKLKLISNNCGTDDYGLGLLLANQQLERVTASYVGDNSVLAAKYAAGEVELELVPQGTLAERMRAGGSGIPAFFTRAGLDTMVADGGMPLKYAADGAVVQASEPKRVETFDGQRFVMERAIRADFALVHAAVGDRQGNLIFHRAARNFNPLAAMCGRTTIAEVERLAEPGELDPDSIHLPGIFVHKVFVLPPGMKKRVDRLTLRGQEEQWGVML